MRRNIIVGLAAIAIIVMALGVTEPAPADAAGECTQYGFASVYDPSTNTCECIAGYVLYEQYGSVSCVTGLSYCTSEFGSGSTIDSGGNCICSSGYRIGTDYKGDGACVLGSSYCYDLYGLFSRYDSIEDACGCSSDYIIAENDLGSGFECRSCFSIHGLHSTYSAASDTCGCDDGYTLDGDDKCIQDSLVTSYTSGTLYRPVGSESVYQYFDGVFHLVPDAGTFAAKRFNWADVKDVNPSAVPAVGSALILIKEGAVIRSETGIDVYIVKYMGTKGFKRLVLNPSVFESYGHLRWEDVVVVPQPTVDFFITADLVRVAGDSQIYRLIAQGDTGIRQPISDAALARLGLDAESIYEINSVDRGSYVAGDSID